MRKDGVTIREATEEWVHEMNAIPRGIIDKLMKADPYDWREVTSHASGDRVYVYDVPDGSKNEGVIVSYDAESDLYCVELDDSKKVSISEEDFEVERDDALPMWGMMWSFGDSTDDYWLEKLGGIQIMSECGFRIYGSDEFGYFFGIDGAGYDFYESHWVPLYKARGLQWHDPMTESDSFVMKEWRKADLYDGLLGYLSKSISSSEELVNVLKKIGFRDEEIEFEGLEVIGDAEDE